MKLLVKYNGFKPNKKEVKYLNEKMEKLAKFIPGGLTKSNLNIVLSSHQKSEKDPNHLELKANLQLPNSNISAHTRNFNFFAIVDITEQKLKEQILKYKSSHSKQGLRHRFRTIINHFKTER